eukprot:768693-Hanusia_phi.AAC.9
MSVQGTGKCSLIRNVAARLGVDVVIANCAKFKVGSSKQKDESFARLAEHCQHCAPCILLLRRSDFLQEDEEGEKRSEGKWLRQIKDELTSFHVKNKMQVCKRVVIVASVDDVEKLSLQTRQLFTHEVELKRPGDEDRERLINAFINLPDNAEEDLSAKVMVVFVPQKLVGRSQEDIIAVLVGILHTCSSFVDRVVSPAQLLCDT